MSLDSVIQALSSVSSPLVTSHVDLDGDAVGSELGLSLLLERMGKKPVVVNQDALPCQYDFLPGRHMVRKSVEEAAGVDAGVVLDCTSLERTGSVGRFMAESRLPIINIDHHSGNVGFGTVNLIRPEACATATIILDLFRALGQSIGQDVATCLYAALVAETGSFRLSNTSAESLEACALLAREGAKPYEIAAGLFSSKSPQALRLMGDAMSSLEIHLNGTLAVLSLPHSRVEESGVGGEELEGIVNFAMSVRGVGVGVFLRELPGSVVKVSLRSNGTVDVDKVARGFGGGGHTNAAGAKIPGTLDEVKGIVVERIAQAVRDGQRHQP
ncbi:MAG: bifunctional oligoribonuclease/PAP phosphatase NrnA [Candidatus Eisenbacteria bacterium]|nr:bifunctional oligoribonuclease/PAP phosphatase NrnA [Candidatus Eisenbacteria bacterium]